MAKDFTITVRMKPTAVGEALHALNRIPGIIKVDMPMPGDEKAMQAKQAGRGRPGAGRGAFDVVRKFLVAQKPGKKFTTKDVKAALQEVGIAPHSSGNALTTLKTKGFVKRTGTGIWSLTAKGAAAIKAELSQGAAQ